MVVSSLKRHAPVDELKERKKIYDDVYTKYNSSIQSNMFRIREMFGTVYYTVFEDLMETELRGMLLTQDACITHTYDDAISNDETKTKLTTEDLVHCKSSDDAIELAMGDLYKGLIHCEYEFTNALFTAVEDTKIDGDRGLHLVNGARTACTLRNYVGTASANAPSQPSGALPANVRPTAFVTEAGPALSSVVGDPKKEAQDDPEDHLHPYFPFAIDAPEALGRPNVRKSPWPVEPLDRHALGH